MKIKNPHLEPLPQDYFKQNREQIEQKSDILSQNNTYGDDNQFDMATTHSFDEFATNGREPANNAKPKTDQPLTQNSAKKIKLSGKIENMFDLSLGIFVCCLIGALILLIYCQKFGAWAGVILLYFGLIVEIPVVLNFIFACVVTYRAHKNAKAGKKLSKKYKIIRVITLAQIPIFVVFCVGVFMFIYEFMPVQREIMKENEDRREVARIYGDDAEILATCGRGRFTVLPNGYEIPLDVDVDEQRNAKGYEDNSIDLEKANKFNYQSSINQIFGREMVSIMTIEDYNDTESSQTSVGKKLIDLDILISEEDLNDVDLLKERTKQLATNFGHLYDREKFDLRLYVTHKIDLSYAMYYMSSMHFYCTDDMDTPAGGGADSSIWITFESINAYDDQEIETKINKTIDSYLQDLEYKKKFRQTSD